MADTDEEVVVHIDNEVLAGALGLDEEAKKAAASDKDVKVKVDTGDKPTDPVDDLKSQFHALQQEAAASERTKADALRFAAEANDRAERAEREREEARGQAAESQYDTVVTGLSAAESEAAAAEQEYQRAFEAGDAMGATKAQRLIARAEAKLARLGEAKADIEHQQETAKTVRPGQDAERKAPRTPADPVEAFIQSRTEPTQKWLRAHTDFITDPKKNARLTSAHYDAVAEGLSPDTKEYFDHVEGLIGITKADAKPAPQRRPASPTVPVQHSGGGMNGSSQEVRLSKSEAAAATDGVTLVWNYDDPSGKSRFKKGDAIGLQEMARRKLAMTKSGQYDKSYTEG